MIAVEKFVPHYAHPGFSELPQKLYPAQMLKLQRAGDRINMNTMLFGIAVQRGDEVCGRVVLYRCTIPGEMTSTLIAGNYECIDDAEVASALLQAVTDHAVADGYTRIIGPMNGTTWYTYRFCMGVQQDPFLSEMIHLATYPEQWRQNGFTVMADYVSAIDRVMRNPTQDELTLEKNFLENGVRFRTMDLTNYRQELERIFEFCMQAFRRNLLFTEIDMEHFLEKYVGMQTMIDPELVIIAEHGSQIVGLCFTFPDTLCAHEKRLVLKTLARDAAAEYKGLGSVLVRQLTSKARSKGFDSVIHALMYAGNFSASLSVQFDGEIFRRYQLFHKKVVSPL